METKMETKSSNNSNFSSFMQTIKNISSHEQIMHLSIYVDSTDEELKSLYINSAKNHNKKLLEDPDFYDAGFDLYLPKTDKNVGKYNQDGITFYGTGERGDFTDVNKVDFNVKCCAKMYSGDKSRFTPFYTYVRSSLAKTPIRLANNQGIIDAGYRGSLIGLFDRIYNEVDISNIYMDKYTRILQICAPGLVPIYVNIVDSFEELGPTTLRGSGGVGSTGK